MLYHPRIMHALPNLVVTAESTNTFKTRLDTVWHNQDIIMTFVHNN